MSERRFFVPPEDLRTGSTLAEDSVALISGGEHHHLRHVLRLKKGDDVSVFDGDGRGFKGVIESITSEESRVRLTGPEDGAVEPTFRLTLAQGIPHHDKMDLIIQKATEIGVRAIVPVIAERTVVRVQRGQDWKRLERWRRVAREAARQSGRLRVPVVGAPVAWAEFIEAPESSLSRHRFILCPGEYGATAPPQAELAAPDGSATVAVGPEGGWTRDEISRATDLCFHRLVLGPRVLRTETAGIVAVALILFLAGELGATIRSRVAL